MNSPAAVVRPGPVTDPAAGDGPDIHRFRVGDMDCPSCVRKIETRLRAVDGVLDVMGSPVSRTVTVRHGGGVSATTLRDEMGRLGYAAHPLDGNAEPPALPTFATTAARITYAAMGLFAVGLALLLAGASTELFATPLHVITLPDLFFLAAAAVGGLNFFDKGLRALWARTLDMNFLMTVAIVGAAVIGETLEAAAIAFLFSLAELLERYSVDRARASVESLMKLAPDTARLIRDGTEVVVPADTLRPGHRVVVRPGERIPADGRVASGASAVDQSPITGESMPVDKAEGDVVYAGTINREGALEIDVEKETGRSTLARIVQLIEEAEGQKSRTERFVERFARWYTPAVTAAAVLVVAVPPLAFGAEFLPWFVRGLTLLVIACPCALVISTPVAVVSGITAAARHGVLIKGGTYLEAMGDVRAIAFDKTGTLTLGHPRVVEVRPEDGVHEGTLVARAAAVEVRSGHPLARAIVDAAEERGLALPPASDYRTLTGAGVEATVDASLYRVVRPTALTAPRTPPADLQADGRTVVGVEADGRFLGWIALADRPREGVADAIAALKRSGIEHVVMLTGDHGDTARDVARRAGVDEVRAELLPEDKVAAIRELTGRWGSVAMVGDGINDGPALATATVGIAMGAAGSDTALETADVALMGDDLSRLPYLKDLSTRAGRVIRQNVAVALAVKAVLAVGVPLGMVSLVAAVLIGDMGVSLAVILNALRLGRVQG
ncbi:MAG: cation-translocating P-type ATPase [Longimicrobiales bacterium]